MNFSFDFLGLDKVYFKNNFFSQLIYEELSDISDMFPRNTDIHSRVTRHGHINIVCPRYKRENEGRKSFTVSGIKTWNNLSIELRKSPSLPSFKKSLKKTFLDKYTSADHF